MLPGSLFVFQSSCHAASPRRKLPQVMANPAMGVPGGWRVRVLWVINEVQRKWEEALPADTRDKLHHDRTSFAAKVGASSPSAITTCVCVCARGHRRKAYAIIRMCVCVCLCASVS